LELLLALQLFPTAPVILDVQVCVGWWQWQQDSGDDDGDSAHSDGDGDGDDSCHDLRAMVKVCAVPKS
jgi:hypothetical protein